MLIGEYQHTIDAKKRMALPAKFRKDLGGEIVVTRGLDRCLFAYPMTEWQKVSEALANLPTGQASNGGFGRVFFAGAGRGEALGNWGFQGMGNVEGRNRKTSRYARGAAWGNRSILMNHASVLYD